MYGLALRIEEFADFDVVITLLEEERTIHATPRNFPLLLNRHLSIILERESFVWRDGQSYRAFVIYFSIELGTLSEWQRIGKE